MTRKTIIEIGLSLVALLMAGMSPNLFPAAQAGIAPMPEMARWLLLPSIAVLAIVFVLAAAGGLDRLKNRLLMGALAGLVATVGLEVVRIISFRAFGGMPGSMPELLGVLLTNRFMLGPSVTSNILGWAYHFWNGACFGMIFALVFGRKPFWWAVIYAEAIGVGFLLSPAVRSMGIGFMGSQMPGMPITVFLAHLVFGTILGLLCAKWIRDKGWLLSRGQ
ncbi:MAG: hypothetical protein P8Z49_05165 [Acidobacteriota bacterium]